MKRLSNSTLLLITLIFTSSVIASPLSNLTAVSTGKVKYMGFIKVYDATLYIDSKATNKNLLDDTQSKCLKLDYAVDLTRDKFIIATETVLKRQNSEQVLKSIETPLQQLTDTYTDIKKGDNYVMCYAAKGQHTRLFLNDKLTFSAANSAEFAKAYLGMWLSSNQPISTSLLNQFQRSLEEQ